MKETSICHRCDTLPRGLFGCFRRRSLGGILKLVISDDDDVAAEWGRRLHREAWAQDGEAFRRKYKGNEYKHYCIFHLRGSYQKRSGDGKLILQNSATAGSHLPSHHHIMVQASTEVVSHSRSRPRTTRRWRRTKMADSRRIGSASAPQMQMAK